jgi:hypothetical protein
MKELFEFLEKSDEGKPLIEKVKAELVKPRDEAEAKYRLVEKQLNGANIEDLLKAKTALDTFGGVDKVKEIELSLAKTEKERDEIKANHKAGDEKLAEITKALENSTREAQRMKMKLDLSTKVAERFGHFADTVFAMNDSALSIEDGRYYFSKDGNKVLLDDKGFETFAESNKIYASAPSGSGQGGNAPTPPNNGNPPKRSLSFI